MKLKIKFESDNTVNMFKLCTNDEKIKCICTTVQISVSLDTHLHTRTFTKDKK